MGYNLKGIRKEFRDKGVFYTDTKLAELMKNYIGEDVEEVYDPTCGDGQLLSVFSDEVKKYGQEINGEQLEVARKRLVNFQGEVGDTLKNPAFLGRKFECIMANYPFSVKWEPNKEDLRFSVCPALPPKSKADYAFVLHILHYLKPNGVAVTLNAPGFLYRGGAEGKVRQYLIEENYIDRVCKVPPGYFEDTCISTVLIVFRKNRKTTGITFEDLSTRKSVVVSTEEIRRSGYTLSGFYPKQEETKTEEFDPIKIELERQVECVFLVDSFLRTSAVVSEFERIDMTTPFCNELRTTIDKYTLGTKHLLR